VTNTQTYLLPGHNESTPTTRKIRPATHERRKGLPEERRACNKEESTLSTITWHLVQNLPANHVSTEPILTSRDLPFFPTTTSTRLPNTEPHNPQTHRARKRNQLNSAIQALDKQRKKEPAHFSQTTSPGATVHEAREKPKHGAANQHPTISNPKIPTIQIPHVLTHRI